MNFQGHKFIASNLCANLTDDLKQEISDIQGSSAQNLWRMRQFYLAYAGNEKLSPLVREISWTKNVVIFMQLIELEGEIEILKHLATELI